MTTDTTAISWNEESLAGAAERDQLSLPLKWLAYLSITTTSSRMIISPRTRSIPRYQNSQTTRCYYSALPCCNQWIHLTESDPIACERLGLIRWPVRTDQAGRRRPISQWQPLAPARTAKWALWVRGKAPRIMPRETILDEARTIAASLTRIDKMAPVSHK